MDHLTGICPLEVIIVLPQKESADMSPMSFESAYT
jgi:hypothetical protein